jgi:hypothetical protein
MRFQVTTSEFMWFGIGCLTGVVFLVVVLAVRLRK